MADYSVTQLLSLINQQVERQENLSECLSKADALIQIAINDGFLEFPKPIIQYYILVLSEVVERARELNEASLSFLIKNTPKAKNINEAL